MSEESIARIQWMTYPPIREVFFTRDRNFCNSALAENQIIQPSRRWHGVCGAFVETIYSGLDPAVNITPRKIECEHGEIEQVMLPLLRGRVFHVTKETNFEDIQRSGWIYSKRQARLAFAPRQPETSYGYKRGWVNLYDLRDPKDGEVKEALIRYWFLRTIGNESAHVYLIVTESAWPSLIPWKRASREVGGKEFFIPFIEAWYPGDIPLQLVADSLVITCRPSPI